MDEIDKIKLELDGCRAIIRKLKSEKLALSDEISILNREISILKKSKFKQ